jgi:N-sulfoglucosamine sulfohydrolase
MLARCLQFAAAMLLFGSTLSARAADVPAASERPNIVLMIADDLGCEDVGAFGNPEVGTPNIDRLAREGLRFDRAFVTTSSCSPSRACIITGRYPHSTGAERLHAPVPSDQVTFVEQLKAHGYWTAAAGKWHLGPAMKDRFDVVHEGDQRAFRLADATADGADKKKLKAATDASGCGQWVATLRDRPRDKPFFLWLASFDPHRDYEPNITATPHRPDAVRVPPYLPDVPEVRRDLAMYYDEISRLDGYVGQVLDELDRQGVADNTLILFLSDNGQPFPRAKTTLYDSGIRTPLLARWPAKIRAGGSCASLVSTVDFAPTLLRLAGIAPLTTFQGVDVSPLFTDPNRAVRPYVFAEQNWHDFEARARAVRSTGFKYIRNEYDDLPLTPPADVLRGASARALDALHEAHRLTAEQEVPFRQPRPREELYDVATDPHEMHDLAGDPAHAQTLAQLRSVLDQWQQSTHDARPAQRAADEFDRRTGEPLPNRVRPKRSS